MSKKITKTRRNISFFKVKTKTSNSFRDLLLYINSLNGNDIYTNKTLNEEKIYLRDLEEKDGFIFGIMSGMRMNGIPKKGELGNKSLSDIGLKPNEGITETTHFLYSPSRNILLVEYNHYGPRVGTLEFHLNDRANNNEKWGFDEVELTPILNYEVMEKLNDLKEIKSFTFSIPKSHIGNLSNNNDSIFDAFLDSYHFGDTGEVTVTLKSEKGSKKPILENIDELKNELEKIGYNIGEKFNKFQIIALSKSQNKSRIYDFLQEKLKTEITVIKNGKDRDLDSEDIFNKMKESFNNNKDEINKLTQYE